MLDNRTHVLYNMNAMKAWNRIFNFLGSGHDSEPGSGSEDSPFELDEHLRTLLFDIARREKRPAREIQADLLAEGLVRRKKHTDLWQRWLTLSPREQDIAALTCLGYTNRQIAFQLKLAPDTVKGYMRQVLYKFRLHSKVEMRLALGDWDFSQWGPPA